MGRTVVRTLIPLLLTLNASCDEPSSPPRLSQSDLTKQLPVEVMRAMIAPGEPCIRRFRPSMPNPYRARVWATRGHEGFLALEFRYGDRAEFNACIVDAIRTARIPVKLVGPVDVPLVFDFTTPG